MGIFVGNDFFVIVWVWLVEVEKIELNDLNVIVLVIVDVQGLFDVCMVLLKEIEGSYGDGVFVFYMNFESVKGQQIEVMGVVVFVMYWKLFWCQIWVCGYVSWVQDVVVDDYYVLCVLQLCIGVWVLR